MISFLSRYYIQSVLVHFICGLICFCVFTIRQDTSFECDSDLDEAAAADSGMNEHHVECGRVYSMAMKLQADATLNSAVTSMFPDEPIVSQLMQSCIF